MAMNFQDMDALGGLISGGQARMTEDTTRINQQNLMQQMAQALQKQQQEAEMFPLKMQQQRGLMDLQKAQTGQTEAQTADTAARTTRENAKSYVEAMIQTPAVPGAEESLAQQFQIPANHPVRRAYKEASAWDHQNVGMFGPGEAPAESRVQQLQKALARSDSASRQKTEDAEAAFKRTEASVEGRLQQERMRQEGAQARAELKATSDRLIAEARQAAAAQKIPSANQVLGAALQQKDKAERMPEGPQKAQAVQEATRHLDEITLRLGNINAARTWAQAEADATRLQQLVPGIQINPQSFQRPPQQPGPAAPQQQPILPPAQPGGGPGVGRPMTLDPNKMSDTPGGMQVPPAAQVQADAHRTQLLAEEFQAARTNEAKQALVREFKRIMKTLPKGTQIMGLNGKPYTIN